MSNDQHDQSDRDDWSAESASLFRDARRAHDPTPLERASIDAVLARIQAGTHAPPSAATSRAPTPLWLGHVAKGALAVALLAATSFGVVRTLRPPSAPTDSEQPPATPAAAAADYAAALPVPTPDDPQPTQPEVTRRQDEPRARSLRHRPPTNVPSQRSSARTKSAVVDVNVVAPVNTASSVTTSSHDTTQHDNREALTAASPASSIQEAAPRATPQKSETHTTSLPVARETHPTPTAAPTELALLKRMHAELRAANFSTVLGLCAEHERRWPHGEFELEREGVRAIASCGANVGEAQRLASQYLKGHPHAPLAMRVKSACTTQLPKP